MKLLRVILVALLLVVLFGTFCWSAPKTTITLTTDWTIDQPAGNGYMLMQMARKYESLNPDVEIESFYVPFSEFVKKLVLQSLTGDLTDIVLVDNPSVLYLASSGVLKDITPLINEWGAWEDFYPSSRLVTSYRGKVYAIQHHSNSLALWYNTDYFKKAGIDSPPETWDDLLKDCQKLKGIEEGVYPIAFCADNSEAGTWLFLSFLWSNNGSLLALDSPESIKALEVWTTLVNEEYAPRDVLHMGQGDITQYFKNKKSAMIIQGCWELSQIGLEGLKKAGLVLGTNFNIAPIPVPKKGLKLQVPMGGYCFGLSSSIDPQKEKIAFDFLTFLCEPENLVDFCIPNGRVPTRASASGALLAERPELKIYAEQAKYNIPRPLAGGGEKYTEISSITINAIQQALSGALSPADAFKQAAGEVKALYKNEEEYKKAFLESESVLLQMKEMPR